MGPTYINLSLAQLNQVVNPQKRSSCKLSSCRQFKTSDSSQDSVVSKDSNSDTDCKFGCVLSCCKSCAFSKYHRATTKERYKSRSLAEKNKHVKGVPCCSAPLVHNVPSVANEINVGGRLQKIWQTWEDLGSNPTVVSILKEGYALPFKIRLPLTRSPLNVSWYADPVKNRYFKEALLTLLDKLVVEKVVVQASLAFFNRLFCGPKTQQQMETHFGPRSTKSVSKPRHLQDGNPGDHSVVLAKR